MVVKYTGPWNRDIVTHLLKRAMFGSKKSDVDYFLTMSMDDAVDELVQDLAVPSPPVKNYLDVDTGFPDGVTYGQTWVNSSVHNLSLSMFRNWSTRQWFIGQMINQPRTVRDKLVLFLTNHFVSAFDVVRHSKFSWQQLEKFYNYALKPQGYKTLLRDSCTDAAMLIYLNGQYNTNSAPDENFAREIQELFALGVDSGYTEVGPGNDIITAARVLTGWRTDYNLNSVFNPSLHDSDPKVFSAFYGNTVIDNPTPQNEVDDLINMLLSKEQIVSRFMVRNLYRWFVYYDIPPDVETNVIIPIAEQFALNWDFSVALKELFTSAHFYTMMGTQIKSPLDLIIGMIREFNVSIPTDVENKYFLWNFVRVYSIDMAQAINDPPDVAGWKSYYQVPEYYRFWLSSFTYSKRQQFIDKMIGDGIDPNLNSNILRIDVVAFAASMSNPSSPDALVKDIVDVLYAYDLTNITLEELKDGYLLNNLGDGYWTSAWNNYVANPSPANYSVVDTRLRILIKYLLNIEQYQLQ